jgi:hypothetical protein
MSRHFPLATLLAAACATSSPRQTPFMKEQGATVSVEAMRMRMRAIAPPMTAQIEGAADRIRRSTTDPGIQRQAIVWKLNMVSSLYRELFSQNPMAGLLDAWAMLVQTENYLSTPESRAAFGEASAEARAATLDIEERVEETFRWAAPDRDPAKARAEIARWAAAHPIDAVLATRRSLREDLATRTAGDELSAFAAAAVAQEDLQGIIARMDFLPAILPKQSMWEAELAYQDYAEPRVEQMLRRADAALSRVDEVLLWLGGPGLQGLADREREALMAAVDKQRVAVAELVAAERVEILEELRKERVAAIEDVRRMAKAATDDASRGAREVADHVLWRAALLVGGAILLWGVVAFLLRRSPAGRAS